MISCQTRPHLQQSITPPTSPRRHAHQPSKLRPQSVTHSSMTPPNAMKKQRSVPNFLKQSFEEYEGNPLPRLFRPVSYASVNVASQHSICSPLGDQQEVEYSPNKMKTMTLPSTKSHGPSHADGMPVTTVMLACSCFCLVKIAALHVYSAMIMFSFNACR